MTRTASAGEAPLSDGEKAILKRLEAQPIGVYWGRNGWVPERLPNPARRKDFDSLRSRNLVQIELGHLVLTDRPDG